MNAPCGLYYHLSGDFFGVYPQADGSILQEFGSSSRALRFQVWMKGGNQVWNDMILIQITRTHVVRAWQFEFRKTRSHVIPRGCIYIYVCVYIYINIMYKPQFSRAWTLRLAAFFLDCVGFSLISLASNPQPCVRSTHFSSDFAGFCFRFSVLPDFPGLSAIFSPKVFSR